MQKALLIAEKPSLKRTIEEVYNKHKNEIPYDITFMEQRGHLLTLKYPNELSEELEAWSWDTLPFHPDEYGGWQYKIIEDKPTGKFKTSAQRYDEIKNELKSGKYDFVINAGDPDQEGELLIRIVLESLHNTLPVKRYWSNALTEEKVLEALKNLRDDDNEPLFVNLLLAAKARQHSDYLFGMNLSRAASLRMESRVALGRVRTPILSIVCKRDIDIKNFVPSTCYGVKITYDTGIEGSLFDAGLVAEETKEDKDGDTSIIWFDTKEEAENMISRLSSPAKVIKYTKTRKETYAPKLYKLATLQAAAGKFGLTSQETLDTVQSLYEKKYLSYPRTDCEYLSSTENFNGMIKTVANIPEFSNIANNISQETIGKVKKTKKYVNDAKLADSGHSAIVPTTLAPNIAELNDKEKIIYMLVCKQFISIFLPPIVQDITQLITECSGQLFKSSGKTLISAGYGEFVGKKFNDIEIPDCNEGDYLNVDSFDVTEKTTTCPKRFTDAELIKLCEKPAKYLDDKGLAKLGENLKIGTPATRASIIESLINDNKYLIREKEGKTTYIIPTVQGMEIYENIKNCDICKVDLTGQWEIALEDIRAGKLTLNAMENDIRKHVEELVEEMKDTPMSVISTTNRQIICNCPSCEGEIISGPKSFYCTSYKEGCKVGTFKTFLGSKISDKDFLSLLNGEEITKTLKNKEGKSWSQKLKYDLQENKILFVETERQPRPEPTKSNYLCPICKSEMTDNGTVIECDSCEFKFFKKTCSVTLTDEQIKRFFSEGSTGLVKGLVSKKSGKKFNANIVLDKEHNGTAFKFD